MHKYVNIVFRQENIGQDIEWIFAIKDSKKAIFLFKWIYFRASSIWLHARTLSVHIQAISINCFVPHRPKHQSSFRKIKSTKMETTKNVCFRLPTPANFRVLFACLWQKSSKRGLGRHFWVITAGRKDSKDEKDLINVSTEFLVANYSLASFV